jgi:hypothetical protein
MIVYLDSQDFSHIANPPLGRMEFYRDLEAELMKLVAAGVIEIRYSAFHISEIAHTTPAAVEYSAGRAGALKRLTNGACLRTWYNIMDDEIRNHFDATFCVTVTREQHQWLDVDFNELGNVIDRLKTSLQEKLREHGANRKQRRAAGKINLAKNLTQTTEGKRALDKIVDSINRRYPLETDLDRAALEGYITGSISKQKFFRYMRGLMADPVNLITRLLPKFDTSLKLPAIVRNQGKMLVETLNPPLEKFEEFFSSTSRNSSFHLDRRELDSFLNSFPRDAKRRAVRQALEDLEDELPTSVSDVEIDKMSLPALEMLVNVGAKCISNAISAAEAGKSIRLFKLSDGADLMHAAYIPYVDIFRCDTAWIDTFQPHGRKFGTQIVGRIEELLPAIRKRQVL